MSAPAANMPRDASVARTVSPWRHARAIALLPFMNTVVIPTGILAASGGAADLAAGRGIAPLLFGAAFLAGGVTLVVHSILQFVRNGQGTLAPWDPTAALVTVGAYGYVRNPMKAGLFLVLLAEAMLLRSLPLLAWFIAFAVANAIYIRVSEEPALRKRFGASYELYCKSVPRWLPRLRSALPRRTRRGGSE
jgi:protein-S-isoprenylcysteine O-methyltransferase Ste14